MYIDVYVERERAPVTPVFFLSVAVIFWHRSEVAVSGQKATHRRGVKEFW